MPIEVVARSLRQTTVTTPKHVFAAKRFVQHRVDPANKYGIAIRPGRVNLNGLSGGTAGAAISCAAAAGPWPDWLKRRPHILA